jgi:hypothetical protein
MMCSPSLLGPAISGHQTNMRRFVGLTLMDLSSLALSIAIPIMQLLQRAEGECWCRSKLRHRLVDKR